MVGVDVDRRMLALAKAERGLEVVQASSSNLPFKDNSISVAVSSASLKDWADRERGLREMLRVVKTDGIGLVYEFLTTGPGSRPKQFVERYGLISGLLQWMMRLSVNLTLQNAHLQARALEDVGETSIEVERDIGVVRIVLRKEDRMDDRRNLE